MASDIPMDVIEIILAQQPTKTLLRFKAVSKSWYSLISSYRFVSNYLLNHSLDHDTNSLLVVHRGAQLEIKSIDNDKSVAIGTKRFDLKPFFSGQPKSVSLLGSCMDLVALSIVGISSVDYVLLNPRTLSYFVVPRDTQFPHCNDTACLGYDEINDDYKLVRVVEPTLRVMVSPLRYTMTYSLKHNSWSEPLVQAIGNNYLCFDRCVLIDDCIAHWVCGVSTHEIIGFNLCSEKWTCLPLPPFNPVIPSSLGDLDGCLCLMEVINYDTNVWVMEEYNVSWTKLFTISGYRISLAPLAYSDGEDEVMIRREDDLFWYNLTSRTFQKIANYAPCTLQRWRQNSIEPWASLIMG